jgi:F-type H+-transporting ATPase subunit b
MSFRTERYLMATLLGLAVCLASPLGAWAAEGAEGKSELLLNLGKLFNLGVVVAVLVWVGRKPLANFFVGRSQAIHDQLEEAQRARRDAEARLAEIESSMSSLDDELRKIREQAEQESQQEYQRVVALAEQDAANIVERARREIDGMTRAATMELKEHAASLSVQLAKDKIQTEITDEDRSRLFDRFVAKVGGSQ